MLQVTWFCSKNLEVNLEIVDVSPQTQQSVSSLNGEIFDWCSEVYICWSGVDLDIFKLKTLGEHLTVDGEAANMEFEQMTTLFI